MRFVGGERPLVPCAESTLLRSVSLYYIGGFACTRRCGGKGRTYEALQGVDR